MRANILSVAKTSPSAAESALASGYGGVLAGAALGSAIGGVTHGWQGAGGGGLAGGIVGGLASTVANAAVKDVMFMVVTDLEIAMKASQGVIVREDSRQNAQTRYRWVSYSNFF